ncbi:MAG: hypothetical protein JWM95_2236 [Gemmatimonadetes bacterium]|nr:hypothetical protein [Gemmatimonadota bacterium]
MPEHSARRIRLVVCASIALASGAHAQGPDSASRPQGVRFSGTVASITTTRPVTSADIRLLWLDSAHVDKAAPAGDTPEFFVDSSRSRVGITNDSGTFAIMNVPAGHYVLNVRRMGFEPVQAVISVGTTALNLQLAMTQVIALLPEVRITESATDRVAQHLDQVGYTARHRSGTSGTFIDRKEILRRQRTYVTELLQAYGVHSDASFTMDRMETDWENLSTYPTDLVVGIEIYRRRGSLSTQFDRTRRSGLTMGANNAGAMSPWTVLIWTYIP